MSDRRSIRVEVANAGDVDDLIRLETRLFLEDAGTHDALVDVSWPGQHAREDFIRLIDNESALVLVARQDERIAGHLVGYLTGPSPTRFGRRTAEIRSLYVDEAVRSTGMGQAMVRYFTTWARSHAAAAISVTAYAANRSARAFYDKLGFVEQSVVLRAALDQ
ncbi:ribosomal protein S18 acetylase RimI-like enzyme [Kribbella amoyensis]|uniref:Ribosomal protein S18 acetylase RimI-like enzyme n=1 Tax=Kribbella amoyensis TaxID=996641 RepID=A0A561BV99_9ACTN|nr:GNAT family N-acetyltransferase [Kribbella amoyensis]TWD82834.1 ribosomal protein S18 acetylase RimI-like enzyme [Kribbella amoyensis]